MTCVERKSSRMWYGRDCLLCCSHMTLLGWSIVKLGCGLHCVTGIPRMECWAIYSPNRIGRGSILGDVVP
jgi:hypothetical protein